MALQPRRVISLPNGRPAVGQLVEYDGNDHGDNYAAEKQLTGGVKQILDKKRRDHARQI